MNLGIRWVGESASCVCPGFDCDFCASPRAAGVFWGQEQVRCAGAWRAAVVWSHAT